MRDVWHYQISATVIGGRSLAKRWCTIPTRRTSTVAHKLSFMTFSCPGLCCVLITVIVIAGCRDAPATRSIDSSATRAVTPPVTGSAPGTGWDSAAGSVLIIAASRTPTDVVIVLPGLTDSMLAETLHFELRGLVNTPVELFNFRGLVGSSILQVSSQLSDSTGCVKWPAGRLANSVRPGWKVALKKGKAIGLPLDSMEAMAGADSARLVADIRNAALSLTDGGDRAFRGIPFFVRKGYRLTTPASSVVIGDAVRKINEEANPREEHLFVLAERSGNDTVYRVGFYSRSAGAEEALEMSEILAALRLVQSGRLVMVITFDYEDGGKVGLLERLEANNWQVVWKSAYTDC